MFFLNLSVAKLKTRGGRKPLVSLYNCGIGLKDNDLYIIIAFSNFEGKKSILALNILHFNFFYTYNSGGNNFHN